MKINEYDRQSEQIIQMLTPKVEVKPSPNMREKILREATFAPRRPATRRISYWLGAVASVAAVVVVAVTTMFNTPAHAAHKYFHEALVATQNIKSMVMKLSVRTKADEPIDYINPIHDFIPATVKVIYGEPMAWSIEKKDGRNILCNGDGYIYEWIGGNDGHTGWKKSAQGVVEGDLAMILDPRLLLEAECRTAERNKGTKYEVIDNGELVVVKATTEAQGDFSESEYQLNTSLAEANTIRVYSFAKSTSELVQMQVDFVVDGKPTTVIVSENITYNEPLTTEALSDKDLSQISFQMAAEPTANESHPLIGISADKAAKIILQAMKEWDEEILGTAMYYYNGDVMKVVESRYRGLEVKSVGEPFKSGLYPGRFVKCKVILADGRKETLALALRNDNKHKIWLVDGGL